MPRVARVFPRRTRATPTDLDAYVGEDVREAARGRGAPMRWTSLNGEMYAVCGRVLTVVSRGGLMMRYVLRSHERALAARRRVSRQRRREARGEVEATYGHAR